MSLFTSTYLPEDAEEKLRQYEYHGQDHSYLFQHFWRPLCRRVVHYLPVWLAANVITVGALFFVCVSHALLSFAMPSFSVKGHLDEDGGGGNVDSPYLRYVLLLAAVALFLYQLLDNLDGHQARRTGTSSPLGLLMDHGCDAFNCIVGGLNLAAALACGPCWKVWVILSNTVVVFFLNTWEEYYRGVLVLPVINGPNEGIVMAIILYVWTALTGGPQWWCNAIEIPAGWLPAVLRQPAPQAAADFEAAVLQRVCPLLLARPAARPHHGPPDPEYSVLPFLFNMNCSESYVRAPPLPTRNPHVDPLTASRMDLANLWQGNSPLQQMVLRLYGSSEDVLHIKYNTVMVWFMTFLAVCTCAGHVYQVYRAISANHKPQLGSGWLYRRHPFLHALTRLLPLFLLTVLSCIWFLTSQEDIFRRHPRLFCWTSGCCTPSSRCT
ncbi:ethanolaminephosphotransferase [Strigomonas culicis]|uniref:Ethanolaminephosphotransferase n=1 Tax=Strigomonas culicis TaxID=28005 RepID=S9TSI6_9TRYP|nr:ethanolaminephosphotransferase [Strigomonas culicis]|eukprot:EPY19468.1 ethanolaminephosphotransferase [Strigomonas culicis]